MPISDLRRAAIRIVQNRFLCSSYMIKSFGFVYFVTKNCLWKPNRDIANKVRLRLMRERFLKVSALYYTRNHGTEHTRIPIAV